MPSLESTCQKSRASFHLRNQPETDCRVHYSQRTAYMAVAAMEMTIELMIMATSSRTRINANVDNPVAAVQMARDFRRPRRV